MKSVFVIRDFITGLLLGEDDVFGDASLAKEFNSRDEAIEKVKTLVGKFVVGEVITVV